MKLNINIRSIFPVLIICLSVLSGCNDSFFDLAPKDVATPENYYENDENMLGAVTATYSNIGDRPMYAQLYFLQKDILSDHVITSESSPEFAEHYNYNFNPTSTVIRDMWHSLYKGIYRANLVLISEPSQMRDLELLDRLKDEVRFLRAYYYWHLITMWREVPLRTEENMNEWVVLKSSREEVYSFIEGELKKLIERDNLPVSYSGKAGEEVGRITIGAVHAMLGKVYLFQEKYDLAVDHFELVLTGPYQLVTDPELIWHISNENNSESILEVQFCRDCWGDNAWYDDGGTANEGTNRSKFIEESVFFNLKPSDALVDLYEEEANDLRRPAFIRKNGEVIAWEGDTTMYAGTFNVIKKGISQAPEQGNFGNDENFPLIRLADVYLMLAEALHLGSGSDADAMMYIDRVRERAFGAGFVSTSDLMTQTGQDLMTIVKKERSKELAFECHRFNDLRRWGDLKSVLGERYVPGHEFYPIPQEDVDKSGGELTQDPNY